VGRADPNASGNHRKNLVRSLVSSFRRLGTDPAGAEVKGHIHEHGTTWIVMTDPEGNEFCVCDGGTTS
jgi:hypothetical protein